MRVIIRVDGDAEIGTGHVMRMVALTEGLTDVGAEVTVAAARLSSAMRARLDREAVSLSTADVEPGSAADARWLATLAQSADWVVLDGYRFKADYQRDVASVGARTLVMDDYGHSERYFADLIVNQNALADAALYADRAPGAALLVGPRYVLLRREFGSGPSAHATVDRATHILVTLGGSRQVKATRTVLEGLMQCTTDLRIRAIVRPESGSVPDLLTADALTSGAATTGACTAGASAADHRRPRFEVLPGADDMAALMAWADMAVASAGTTTWELARMGVPTLFLILADNQVLVAEAAARAGFGVNLGGHEALTATAVATAVERLAADRAARTAMRAAGQQAVDGLGRMRVVDAMRRKGQDTG